MHRWLLPRNIIMYLHRIKNCSLANCYKIVIHYPLIFIKILILVAHVLKESPMQN